MYKDTFHLNYIDDEDVPELLRIPELIEYAKFCKFRFETENEIFFIDDLYNLETHELDILAENLEQTLQLLPTHTFLISVCGSYRDVKIKYDIVKYISNSQKFETTL